MGSKVMVIMALLLVTWVCPLAAQTDADDLGETVEGTVDIERGVQERRDEWAQEESELLARYRTAKANVDYLSERKATESEKATALRERVEEFERRLEESDRLQASLQDTLDSIFTQLEEWVNHDIPFLAAERTARLESLRKELARPDVTGTEKLRRLLEALQVEAGYGSTVEVYQQQIQVTGERLSVDVLRIGRVSVFWRTPDGERIGGYDPAGRQWVELSGKYNRAIGQAMDMAARIRPVELIALPLGRIQP